MMPPRSPDGSAVWHVLTAFVLATATAAAPVRAQVQPQPRGGAHGAAGLSAMQARGGWQLEASAAVDLWYHGLAVIGVGGAGTLPLYSTEYARRIRSEKERLGIYPTRLDRVGAEIRQSIERDEGLALLHFAPLYFHGADPKAMLRALSAVAGRRAADVALVGPRVRFGAIVMTQALQTGGRRRVVQQLVEALTDEYEVFFRDYHARHGAETGVRLADLDRRWTHGLALDLADFLVRSGLESGVLIPSPALGPEGRLFQGNPASGHARLVAVWMPVEGAAAAPLYGAVRELGFVVVDRVVDPTGLEASELEALRARAAVRCGALLLEFYAPAQLSGYRRAFLEAIGHQSNGRRTTADFEQAFPLDPEMVSRLRWEVRRR